ncbi:MAG: hypothetical protein U0Y68_21875 [Blastocatellia bacterium]
MTNQPQKQTDEPYKEDQTSEKFTDREGNVDVYRKLHQTAEADAVGLPTTPRPVVPTVPENQKQWVGRSFASRESAEEAYQLLRARGYEDKEINLLLSQETREKYFPQDAAASALQAKAQQGKMGQATDGAMKGALIGTLLSLAVNMVFPIGALLFAGPIFVGVGALTGGLRAGLTEVGISAEEAAIYENDVNAGRIVMGVKPHNAEDAEYLAREWRNL